MNKAEFVLKLEQKIEEKKQEFVAKFGSAPNYIKMGYFVDMCNGKNHYNDGDQICGLVISKDEHDPIVLELS